MKMVRGAATCGLAVAVLLMTGCPGRRSLPPPKEMVTLTVKSDGEGGGRVRSSPLGLDCQLTERSRFTCARKFEKGTRLMLSAAADTTSYFVNWQDDIGLARQQPDEGCAGRGYCLITLDHDREVVVKFDKPGGDTRWTRSFGGQAANVAFATATDKDGNVVIAGSYEGTVSFNRELPNAGGSDVFLVKYNGRYGGIMWAYRFGGAGWDRAAALAISDKGTILVTGRFEQEIAELGIKSAGGYDGFVAAFADGTSGPTPLWARTIGSKDSEAGYAIAVKDSAVYVSGTFRTGFAHGAQTPATRGDTDVFLLQYEDIDGKSPREGWIRGVGSAQRDYAGGLAVLGGTIAMAGGFGDTLHFAEPGDPIVAVEAAAQPDQPAAKKKKGDKTPDVPIALPTRPSAGDQDAFVVGLDIATGQARFAATAGGKGRDVGHALAAFKDDFVLVGSFDKSATFGTTTLETDAVGVFVTQITLGGTVGPSPAILVGRTPQYTVSVVSDGNDGILLAGTFDGNLPADRVGNANDLIISRYKRTPSAIEHDWTKRGVPTSKRAQVYGLAATPDRAGGIVVTGAVAGEVEIKDLGVKFNAVAAMDVFVIKVTDKGRYGWKAGSTDRGEDIGRAVAIAEDGSPVVVGSFKDTLGIGRYASSAGGSDVFVVRFDQRGDEAASHAFGGTDEDAALGVASMGDVVAVAGSFGREAKFAKAGDLPSKGRSDAFVAWYSLDKLEPKQIVAMGGSESDVAQAVAMDPSGNTYVAGTFGGAATFGSESRTAPGTGSDAFVAKLDGQRNLMWVRRLGGNMSDTGYALAVTPLGGVLVAGQFRGTEVTIEGKSAPQKLPGGGDGFVASFDAQGKLLWLTPWGEAERDEAATAVDINSHGEIVVALRQTVQTIDDDKRPPVMVHGKEARSHALLIWLDPAGKPIGKPLRPMKSACHSVIRALDLDDAEPAPSVVVTGEHVKLDYKAGEREVCKRTGDIFVTEFSSFRQMVWEQSFGSDGDDDACGIARTVKKVDPSKDPLRNLDEGAEPPRSKDRLMKRTVVTGNFSGTIQFGKGSAVTSVDSADVFVVELGL